MMFFSSLRFNRMELFFLLGCTPITSFSAPAEMKPITPGTRLRPRTLQKTTLEGTAQDLPVRNYLRRTVIW